LAVSCYQAPKSPTRHLEYVYRPLQSIALSNYLELFFKLLVMTIGIDGNDEQLIHLPTTSVAEAI
jgi:hypothetical protein